ncbi:hypothetical protein MHZ92_04285 [Sporosarcina sp. ACRSL]|uniref:hypothetical protein n=1 Tax=Sporosarcina sp. ACRSL TaxID=2918215 RepID=UPI001EF41D51|nr:hypothetical protein [Sporosarcina sp. ACRSL]MCG7343336.1 hypothetical protein [Sporosarcina sp. ACRSL]
MQKNLFPPEGPARKMTSVKKFYYVVVQSVIGAIGAGVLYLFFRMLPDGDWFITLLFGSIALFIGWLFVKLLLLPSQKGPTTFKKVETADGYTIYFINEWTGETESVSFRYDQITDLLIGLWTNPGFKGRKNDYVGARLLYRYNEDSGKIKYNETVIISENSLNEWIDIIQKHRLPAKITNMNISAVTEDQFEEMLETIDAIPFEESISVTDYFMQQEDFSL